MGDLFGSSPLNVAILAIADLASRQAHLLSRVAREQAMVTALAIGLTAMAIVGVLSGDNFSIAGIGWAPWLIAAAYVLGTRLLYRIERTATRTTRRMRRTNGERIEGSGGLSSALSWPLRRRFGGAVSCQLRRHARAAMGNRHRVLRRRIHGPGDIAAGGLNRRRGDEAGRVRPRGGQLRGSNCFNMAILFALDIAEGGKPLLAAVDPGAATGAVVAVLPMSQVLLDHLNRPEKRVWYLEPGPGLMLATCAAGLFLTYRATH